MNYDKPKVTIDLDEYLMLKKKADKLAQSDGFLKVGQTVSIKHEFNPMADKMYKVQDVRHSEDGKHSAYSLKNYDSNIIFTVYSEIEK